ncbi:MAG: outer membrane lipoprotein-sorting protein, partial [Saprospiraceae bacterium]
LIALCAFVAVQAQSADDILAKYFENTGGLDKWKTLEASKMVGTMSMQGMEFPGTIYAARPNKQRVEVSVQGKNIVQAYDGTDPWWINPFAGSEDAQKMPAEMSEEMTKATFESEFLNYKEKGHAVELVGKETIEGAETWQIKLTKKNGDVEHHFFDTEHFVLIMTRTMINNGPMKGQHAETFLSDYQEVDGIVFPFFIEVKMGGQTAQKITISSVELNGKYDNAFFAMPKK